MKWLVLAVIAVVVVWWYRRREPPRAIVVTPPPAPPSERAEPIDVEFAESSPRDASEPGEAIASDDSKPSDPDKDPS